MIVYFVFVLVIAAFLVLGEGEDADIDLFVALGVAVMWPIALPIIIVAFVAYWVAQGLKRLFAR